jgi:propionate CoA-transferase
LLDDYSAMVRSLVDRFYSGVSRYTTSGFLRIKLGEAQLDWRQIEGIEARDGMRRARH